MLGKVLILLVTLTAASLAYAPTRHNQPAPIEAPRSAAGNIATATVEVESLCVISYLDENGNWRPPDSTLVPPVPLRGPREVAIVTGRAPAAVAERVRPR
jgi:hypothetical protein